jgi:hypothetical protein
MVTIREYFAWPEHGKTQLDTQRLIQLCQVGEELLPMENSSRHRQYLLCVIRGVIVQDNYIKIAKVM